MFTTHIWSILSVVTPAAPLSASSGGSMITLDINGSVVVQLGVFSLLFLLLKPVLLDPFLKVVEEREKRTEGAKAEARAADEKAGKIKRRYDRELDKVRRAAGQERERLRAEAIKLEQEMLVQARVAAQQVTQEGKDKVHAGAEQIRRELHEVNKDLARQVAAKVLGRQVQG